MTKIFYPAFLILPTKRIKSSFLPFCSLPKRGGKFGVYAIPQKQGGRTGSRTGANLPRVRFSFLKCVNYPLNIKSGCKVA